MFLSSVFLIASFISLTFSLSGRNAARPVGPCDNLQLSQSGSFWQGGFTGSLEIPIAKSVDRWTIELDFSAPVSSFKVWEAVLVKNIDNRKFRLRNANYNGVKYKGDILSVGIDVTYSPLGKPPVVAKVLFNGINVCSGSVYTTNPPRPTTEPTTKPSPTPYPTKPPPTQPPTKPTTYPPPANTTMSCSATAVSVTITNRWTNGFTASFAVPIVSDVTSWTLDVVFSAPVTTVQPWEALLDRKEGKVYRLKNARWNGRQSAGTVMKSVGVMVNYAGSSSQPKIVEVKFNGHISREKILPAALEEALEAALQFIASLSETEKSLSGLGHILNEKLQSARPKMSRYKKPKQKSTELGKIGIRMIEKRKFLKNKYGLSEDQIDKLIGDIPVPIDPNVQQQCVPATSCDCYQTRNSKHRKNDGSCNNLNSPKMGQSFTNFHRLVKPPAYADGVYSVRRAVDKSELPYPRKISVDFFDSKDRPSSMHTTSLVIFGQFINHDMQRTPQPDTYLGSNMTIACCTDDFRDLPGSSLNLACLNIVILPDDKFFNKDSPGNQTCMGFKRSIVGPPLSCNAKDAKYADQLNEITHWLDNSNVYGSDESTAASVRLGVNGLLKTSSATVNGIRVDNLLPVLTPCPEGSPEPCFFAGDFRLSEQPSLALMHTLWVRLHNKIAVQLDDMHPDWDDRRLFKETRRIVNGVYQNIIYNEYLYALLGADVTADYNLRPLPGGKMFTGYDDRPTRNVIYNEFATAAFRMGHSMAQGFVPQLDENFNKLSDSFFIADAFGDTSKFVTIPHFIDNSIRGLATQPTQTVDEYVVDDLWLELFRGPGQIFAFDLVAINIQRGRDHGLRPYNDYREFCKLGRVDDFDDLLTSTTAKMEDEEVDDLKKLYKSVNDIDLFVGGLAEEKLPGSLLGPTFTCIVARQFQLLKFKDRFYYELAGQPGSFTPEQLAAIKKYTLARFYCDTGDNITVMQRKAFNLPDDKSNPRVPCNEIPELDLGPWINEPDEDERSL